MREQLSCSSWWSCSWSCSWSESCACGDRFYATTTTWLCVMSHVLARFMQQSLRDCVWRPNSLTIGTIPCAVAELGYPTTPLVLCMKGTHTHSTRCYDIAHQHSTIPIQQLLNRHPKQLEKPSKKARTKTHENTSKPGQFAINKKSLEGRDNN